MMKKAAFLSLGCKVNAYETEAMQELFRQAGYAIVPFEEESDVYVVNTCTVTQIADKKSRQMLHRAKKKNPEAVVIAVGCYVEAEHSRLDLDDAVDILIGTRNKGKILNLLQAYSEGTYTKCPVSQEPEEAGYEELSVSSSADGHARAYLKIQDGCNQFCSYCIIPYVRGRIRSRSEKEILTEAQKLAENGYQEIVLTGIHISSYGVDRSGETELLQLIKHLDQIPGIRRIRLGSLEPRIVTETFAKELAKCEHVCPHFHLSLQSGSDHVLRQMNRHYTREDFLVACRLLKEAFDRPGITTDLIAGFPGETEEDFEDSLRIIEEAGFLKVHVFPYSRRSGTRADRMPDQVPDAEKKRRAHLLSEEEQRVSFLYLQQFAGDSAEVLVEEEVKDDPEIVTGHTANYIEVRMPKRLAGEPYAGKMVRAEHLIPVQGYGMPTMMTLS